MKRQTRGYLKREVVDLVSDDAELSAPLSKQLELQAALRADHYEQIGSSVNPKLGLRYQPSQALVLRASAGTGFRAPDLAYLFSGLSIIALRAAPEAGWLWLPRLAMTTASALKWLGLASVAVLTIWKRPSLVTSADPA